MTDLLPDLPVPQAPLAWVDFTRRNDPAHLRGVPLLREHLMQEGDPRVLCFWTKAPNVLHALYLEVIQEMQHRGTLVLAQVTLNHYEEMEPGIGKEDRDLSRLVPLLGPDRVRIRFDPIIPGYTTPHHFKRTLRAAEEHGIRRITVNFVVTRYKGVGRLLGSRGIDPVEIADERKAEILARMLQMTPKGIELAVCAETAALADPLSGLKGAACADPQWAASLLPSLQGLFKRRPSRKGCGCVYSADWGRYPSKGGHICPHGCLYCYAK